MSNAQLVLRRNRHGKLGLGRDEYSVLSLASMLTIHV
ncbi:hypothetical protein DyAD56_15550 [Dyella sp. AD56]|nr:hypothetical protein DyAD56_15550 [Dyella sp. AD56]